MVFGNIFIVGLVEVVVVNLIRFGCNIIKDLKRDLFKVHGKKQHNLINKLRIRGFILEFCILSIIINPIKLIPFFLHEFISFLWKCLKRMVLFFYYFLDIKTKDDFYYINLSGFLTIVILLTWYVLKSKSSIIKNTSLLNSITILFWTGAMFIAIALLIIVMTKFKTGKDKLDNLSGLILGAFMLLVLAVSVLAEFEKYKNSEARNIQEVIVPVGLLIYVVIILLIVLKNILDRGSIFKSATLGIIIYIMTLIFITNAVGFYLTGRYPEYFKKDEITIIDKNQNELLSYMASYSYRGAKYLMSFPDGKDFKDSLNANENERIPIDVYLLYFFGLIINIVITAFFVSYAVSVYIMRVSADEAYLEFIKKKDFIDKYLEYNIKKYNDTKIFLAKRDNKS